MVVAEQTMALQEMKSGDFCHSGEQEAQNGSWGPGEQSGVKMLYPLSKWQKQAPDPCQPLLLFTRQQTLPPHGECQLAK